MALVESLLETNPSQRPFDAAACWEVGGLVGGTGHVHLYSEWMRFWIDRCQMSYDSSIALVKIVCKFGVARIS